MQQPRGRAVLVKYRALIAVAVTLGYACAFLLLRATLGESATYLSVLPVVVIAWSYGFRSGLAAGLLLYIITLLLLVLTGALVRETVLTRSLLGTMVLVFVGGTVGWMRDLHRRVGVEVAERQRAEAELRAIFDSAAVGIALSDRGGRVIESNAALSRLVGYSA